MLPLLVLTLTFGCLFLLVDLDLVAGGLGGLFGGDAIRQVVSLGRDGFDDLKGVLVGEYFFYKG